MLNNSIDGLLKVTLIDFGFAKKFEGLREDTEVDFEGNFLFASRSQLEFRATFPKDDLHSLCYLLIYLLNGCNFPHLQVNANFEITEKNKHHFILDFKRKNSIETLI